MGKTSGLDAKDQENLKRWDDYFHYEVHGGHVSLIQELRAVLQGLPQIGPAADQDAFIMYMNRSAELGWIITRLMPFLQLSKDFFGSRWREKHAILEDSFRYMLEGFSNLGKELGPSFIRMMDAKFAFKDPFFYFEADGVAR